ncbi:type 2 periplasmic-binding domain-containing protein [Spartinivicinus ruber]|uniref:transporter substrate-binding domain-containing protein n=1 Tax=Spartinivicinus ruber TaxID=2683272 RepID=UPI0013D42DBA|nr:transporter substrate-binding domain-containing protein [Spartinivicinus ruber]
MNKPLVILTQITYLLLPNQAPAKDQPIEIYYHERPYYYFIENNKLAGIVGTKAQFILDASGISYRLLPLPAEQQLAVIKNSNNKVCAIGWFRNKQREQFSKYSIPIYQDLPAVVITTKFQTKVLKKRTIDELLSDKQFIIGIKSGYSYGDFLDKKLAQHTPKAVFTEKDSLGMLSMLKNNQINYFISAYEEAYNLIEDNHDFVIHN